MAFVKLIAFAVLLAMGQILFKKAALFGVDRSAANQAAGESPDRFAWIWSFLNPWMAAALTLYTAATVLWVLILRSTPISIAYPFVALGFVLVPLAGHLLFDERLSLATIAGCGLIVTGVLVIAAGASS